MPTTQPSRQVQPEPILTVGTYHGGSVLISKLTLGSESVYIRNTSKGAKFFPLLIDAFFDLYDTSVAARVQYKKSSPGRDRADENIKAILDWAEDYIESHHVPVGGNSSELTGATWGIVEINKRSAFSSASIRG